MPKKAIIFIAGTATVGVALLASSLLHWHSSNPVRFWIYLIIALLSSRLKIVLPEINGSMSVSFLFILLGMLELSLPETMVLGCAATLLQVVLSMTRPARPIRLVFNVFSMMAPAIWISYWVHQHSAGLFSNNLALMTMSAACVYFLANTLPVAIIISLSENKPFRQTWFECHFWSFSYYLAGAALVVLFHYVNQFIGWQVSVIFLPVIYFIYYSYRQYLGRLEAEKTHVESMASLHLRTIEALALAIEAKDHTTFDHLQRVRVYATEIGKEMGLSAPELEALKAASILHDIGKLAVPEHIISKPGKLTQEEFEKMKIHPAVGAKILERVKFPYPVAPIVRSHHEKWDGSGYPDGLKGEAIPLAARILSAVDCLDALASERQYRRALPLDKAMEYVAGLAGKEFDPKVIKILQHRYIELERVAGMESAIIGLNASEDMNPANAAEPAAGFVGETGLEAASKSEDDFLVSIAGARQEAHMLFELTHDLGNSLSLDDTLSVACGRLRKLVPYDAIAIWIRENEVLIPRYVNGDDFRLFSSLEIPLGQGLSGWVVSNTQPILNGNPSVEPGYLGDATKFSHLRSALSIPLESLAGTIGALTLYRADSDAFSRDDLRILRVIGSKFALSIENALRFQQAQTSATTDFLTGLPNARSLFLHLDAELARCKRSSSSLAVMVCDLNRFKEVNDRFGHLEGNQLLREYARLLRENCREYDYVARMGGDEFVVIAPGLTEEAASHKTDLMSDLAEQAGRMVCQDKIFLSASIGTAFYVTDGTDAEQLLAEADRRMYTAKRKNAERLSAEERARVDAPRAVVHTSQASREESGAPVSEPALVN